MRASSSVHFETKAGTADLNDTPRLIVTPGESYRLRFEIDGKAMETAPFKAGAKDMFDVRAQTSHQRPISAMRTLPFPKKTATRAIAFTYETILADQKENRARRN